MKQQEMKNLHVLAFAYAAGIRPDQDYAVSHPRYYPPVRRLRLRRLLARGLKALSRLLVKAATRLSDRQAVIPASPCCEA